MLDPDEGLNADGTIRTGASAGRIRPPFHGLLDDVVAAVEARAATPSVYVFGSVATGQAVVGASDVDVLAVGLEPADAAELTARLSERHDAVCRSVDVGAAAPSDFAGDRDEAYGNRVFLRHYCVHLAGPDLDRSSDPFAGDRRAARGFNGDIARHHRRWREAVGGLDAEVLGRRVARKSLLAAAGVVSVHDSTWTTDRDRAARRLGEIDPAISTALLDLLVWSSSAATADDAAVRRMLDGPVAAIVRRFADQIGLWPD